MAKPLWVQAQTHDRKVILSEADPAHPTPNHEVYIVGYEDPRFDADGNEITPANPPIEVGDTPGVRGAIARGDLIEVERHPARMQAAERETQSGNRAAESKK